jgi:hypothetical protein
MEEEILIIKAVWAYCNKPLLRHSTFLVRYSIFVVKNGGLANGINITKC